MTWNGPRLRTVADIAESVRDDIVTGRLRTGSEIVLADLSEELDAALGDVRQALLRLTEQHLVTSSADGSFHVVTTSTQDLQELTALRQLLEGEAVRLSAKRRDEAWSARVRDAHSRMVAAASIVANPGLVGTWRDAHREFHEALCADCGNERLLAVVAALRDEAEIYRELSAMVTTAERRTDVDREHLELLESAVAGRGDEAADVLRRHLEGTMRTLVGERDRG